MNEASAQRTEPWPDRAMVDAAMGIICNVGSGDWQGQSQEWQDAARQWLEAYVRLGAPSDRTAAPRVGLEPTT